MRRPAVELDDRDLVRLGLDRLEQRSSEVRPCRLEHGEPLRRKLGANDIVQLGRERAPRVEQRVAARLEHTLEAAVAREEGALAILHGHAQDKQMPRHGTSPSLPSRMATALLHFEESEARTRLPVRQAGRGLSPCERRAYASAPPCRSTAAGWTTRRSRGRYPPRRKAGVTVSRYERGAFRRDDRTATEARVRSPSWESAWQADFGFQDRTGALSGIRTRDRMIKCHVLYPTELSSRLVEMTGIEPVPPGLPRRSP